MGSAAESEMTDRQGIRTKADRCAGPIGLLKTYPPSLQATIENYVLSSLEAREKQGLPRHIEDTDVLDTIVTLLTTPQSPRDTGDQSPAA